MPFIHEYEAGTRHFLMGNEAIAGSLGVGRTVAAGLPWHLLPRRLSRSFQNPPGI